MQKETVRQNLKKRLNFGENGNLVRDVQVFKDYEQIKHITGVTSSEESMIVGVGIVRFKFSNKEVSSRCKHAPDFKESLLCLSMFVREFSIQFLDG